MNTLFNKIPRKIWKTYKTKDLPPRVVGFNNNWATMNQTWDLQLFDDDDIYTFLSQHFSKELMEFYNNLPLGVMKADLWRYCILYIYGGVYVDIDTECKAPIDSWFYGEEYNTEDILIVTPEYSSPPSNLCNWAFIATPNHPCLKFVIDYMVDNYMKNGIDLNNYHFVHGSTGPGIFKDAVNIYLGFDKEKGFDRVYNDYIFSETHRNNIQQKGVYIYDQFTFKTTYLIHINNDCVGENYIAWTGKRNEAYVANKKKTFNKTIYMCYNDYVPPFVFYRWTILNNDYKIEYSTDVDCVLFLNKHFGNFMGGEFLRIEKGMFKAYLWRLCKLYIEGGVYSDVDLVPYVSIDELIKENKASFYSCASECKGSIFQAFMVSIKKRNALILCFIISFLINQPYYDSCNGPTKDMYNCIRYNTYEDILPEKTYVIENCKIPIKIGTSKTHTKVINLYYFPDDIKYKIEMHRTPQYKDLFDIKIENNLLIIKRIDSEEGWGYCHSCDIYILDTDESVYLFPEKYTDTNIS